MTSKKYTFTKAKLDNEKLPDAGDRLVLMDGKIAGLQCRITPAGVKTFCVYKRIKGGQPERITLGRYPEMSVEQARTQAQKILAAIAGGGNPGEVRRAHKEEKTLDELFDLYLERHAKVKKRTWKDDLGRYNLHFKKPLGGKKVSQVTRVQIANLNAKLSQNLSPASANRTLAILSSIFSWGCQAGYCDHNPVKGIKRNPIKTRDRFLQADEFPRFFEAVRMEQNTTIRDYILVSLLTGARRSNVLAMQWDEVNFDRQEWRIPRTKNNEPQIVTLTPEVTAILKTRLDDNTEGAETSYVFPGEGKNGHLVEPKKGWKRILERAGIENLRIHDLRRTLGSWQAKTGASLIIIGKSLNHKSLAATQIYSRLDTDPVRQSVERATNAMLEAAGMNRKAAIVNLSLKGRSK